MIPARVLPPPPGPVSLAKLLLVEGDTPLHFFEALLRHLGLQNEMEIRNYHGIRDLRTYLLDLASSEAFRRLVTSVGIVRDAEDKPATAARQSVTDAMAAAGLTPARVPPIRTSLFILPDNINPGMLETLCMQAVRSEAGLAGANACVEQFFACLGQSQVPLPGPPQAEVSLCRPHR
jgi:hypothetical protein